MFSMIKNDCLSIQKKGRIDSKERVSQGGLVSKLGCCAKGIIAAAAVGSVSLNPQPSDAGVIVWANSPHVTGAFGAFLDHRVGATDGYDSNHDYKAGSLPPGPITQYIYSCTLVDGFELRQDVRDINAPYSPFNVQCKARSTSGSFDVNDFRLAFTRYELTEGITDWSYKWHVPGVFTSSGQDYFEEGMLNDLEWFPNPHGGYYAQSLGSVNILGVRDGDIFSNSTMQPVSEPGTLGLFLFGVGAFGSFVRKKKKLNKL
jgi:hypothetical protein